MAGVPPRRHRRVAVRRTRHRELGPAEIRGNAVKDLAALNKIETLPWDEWGRMTDAYDGKTGGDYDELHDTLASNCAANDSAAVTALYAHDDFRVPIDLIC
jgi:hypothetical protein